MRTFQLLMIRDLSLSNQAVRSLASSCSSLEIPDLERQLSPIRTVSLLPNVNDAGDLSCVVPFIAGQRRKPPAVTTVLKESMDEESALRLHRWRRKKIKELGEEGFKKLNRETLSRGTSLHDLIQQYFQNNNEPDFERASLKVRSFFQSALPELRRIDHYVTGEIFSTNPLLFYRGKIDTLVIIDGEITLVEWKTSSRQQPKLASTYDAPIQAAAYLGALNRDPSLFDIVPGIKTSSVSAERTSKDLPATTPLLTRAKIIVCYDDASPATAHDLSIDDLEAHWGLWRERLVTFWLKLMVAGSLEGSFSRPLD